MSAPALRCSRAQAAWRRHRRLQLIGRAARWLHHALAAAGAVGIGLALAWLLR